MPAGTKIQLGDREYLLAPMNIKTMKAHQDLISQMSKPSFDVMGQLDSFAALVQAAIQRTVPDVTLDEIEANVDMGNIPALMEALFRVSGFVAPAGELAPGKVSSN